MTRTSAHLLSLLLIVILAATTPGAGRGAPAGPRSGAALGAYIVQAPDTDGAAGAVTRAGGTVTARLGIIHGVAATLDGAAASRLQGMPGIVLHADTPVQQADDPARETDTGGLLLYPAAATATDAIHNQRAPTPVYSCMNGQSAATGLQANWTVRGWGVTVAVIDSGLMKPAGPLWTVQNAATHTLAAGLGRCFLYRDFLPRTAANGNTGADANTSTDQNGHGTHVAATIADYHDAQLAPTAPSSPVAVAPGVNVMIARALDRNGAGTYSSVIAALDWVVANQATFNVKVLNLSLHAPVTGPYWADPLDQAVMRAWQAGITVVAAAGNAGPGGGTITVPGNVPYVITAGAVKSGRYTVSGADELARYSSRGPTESAFVKPDVVVPASRTIAPMPNDSVLAPLVQAGRIQEAGVSADFGLGNLFGNYSYYQLSGTSMAAAEVSGIAALILQANPRLTNDQVKYRLLATARPALDPTTNLPIYSVWEQGAGLVNAPAAVFSTSTERANAGLNLTDDLTTSTHYWGWTTWDPATQTFRLTDPSSGQPVTWMGAGQIWSGTGQIWSGTGQIWSGTGQIWSGTGQIWSGTGQIWSGGTPTWTAGGSLWAGTGQIWSGSTPATAPSTAANATLILNEP